MSEITIVYKDLEEAADKARDVESKCKDYEDELNRKVCNKISGIAPSPMSSGNARTNSANLYVKNKKKELSDKARNYRDFAKKCDELATNAKNADKRVAVQVNNSRETFLKENTNLSGDGWNAFVATLIAEVPGIGWIAEGISEVKSWGNDLMNTLRRWYEMDGGKKIIDTALAVVGVVVAVAAVIVAGVELLAAATIGAVVVAAIGLVGAIIGLANAITDMVMQIKADTCKDPAFANYYGNQNTLATYLRKKTYRGEDRWFNNWSNGIATGLEVTEIVCSIVSIGSGLSKAFKDSGVKDMCGKTVKGKDLYGREIDVFKYDWSDVKSTFGTKDGWAKIGSSFKKNWKNIVFGRDKVFDRDAIEKNAFGAFDEIGAAKKNPELKTKQYWKELPSNLYREKGIKHHEALLNLQKSTKGYNRGIKLISTKINVDKMIFDKAVYNENDYSGIRKNTMTVLNTGGGIKTGFSIYDTGKKVSKYSENWFGGDKKAGYGIYDTAKKAKKYSTSFQVNRGVS